ncbi:hypothetical protein MLD38_014309 [Melastoma candidum]|uniref:Uncharacterized protein n=1 Tax=Melastoma candidum TaxID=119954 RepID=A0ACB9RDP4_9MYRT|nr:hypothetical protein MLD38_014309 [Melastoma candidum]
MGRAPCCDSKNVRRGPWSQEEDALLTKYMLESRGKSGSWIALPHRAGLKRCGKSCRLRWMNYLRPDIKRGRFTEEEDEVICALYLSIGSRQLPGRTDNDIKNYWNTKLKKKLTESLLARNLSFPEVKIADHDHPTKSSLNSYRTPFQAAEDELQSSFKKDVNSEMLSASVPATDSDFDSPNTVSNDFASTFWEEEGAYLDFGGRAFFGNFGHLD